MPGSQKSPFLATNRDFGSACNAALALVVGWILGQLKWNHMLITGLVFAAILIGVQVYRYDYARRHPLGRRRRPVPTVNPGGNISAGGGAGISGAEPPPSEDARRVREQHARALERQQRLRHLAPRITIRSRPEAELMPRSEALRQTLGLAEKGDTTV